MVIRTKIVATIGPASRKRSALRALAEAGVDVFRINFSHGTDEQHEQSLSDLRAVEDDLGRPVAILGDLCGPKIRVGHIAGGSVLLAEGQHVTVQRESIEGNAERISTTLQELVDHARAGQSILVDDGKIRLKVLEASSGREVLCEVQRGGILASGKGMNLPETSLNLAALTEKDRRDAAWIAQHDFDYVALSFVRQADDVRALRQLLEAAGCQAPIIAKIEKPEAVERIEEIASEADGIMVARGDLGVEMDLAAVPVAQKQIARVCQAAGKPCIIATQMLETMTARPTPTRAEVSDVANAVLDQTDAVMLSGETAVGEFPVEAVTMMNDIVARIQAYHDHTAAPVRPQPAGVTATAWALAAAVQQILQTEEIAAVAIFTITGATARLFSKHRLTCPILGLSPERPTVRRMCLYYGVRPMQAEMPQHTRDVLAVAEDFAVRSGIARKGQKIVVISGRPLGQPGCTNTLVVHTIGGQS